MEKRKPMSNPEALQQSIDSLRGVSPARAVQLRRLGIQTIGDLLQHLPRSYEEFSGLKKIAALAEGQFQTVKGEVIEIEGKQTNNGRQIVSIILSDGGPACLEGVWFNQPWIGGKFRYGQQVAFTGKAKWYRDHWQMSMPQVRSVEEAAGEGEHSILPVYPLTEDLRVEQLRTIMRRAVRDYAGCLLERLPQELRRRRQLPDVAQALQDVHFPESLAAAKNARRRFAYEEFLLLQLALAVRRRDLRHRQRAPVMAVTPTMDARIRRLFPFKLTNDQDRAIADITRDLAGERPMQRLLQADVGAGKTAVAVYALLVTVANKHQAALMAPTEVLAQQHWNILEAYLAHSRVRRLLLTGALTSRERKDALAAIAAGEVDLVVGTQALVQEGVQFARLGLVVVDEQHKFGVNQRARIRKLGIDPHYLIMTATPIPRTVALTVFGDLDVSTIKELPPGRQPVRTSWVGDPQRARVYQQLRDELARGKQMFVVCPLVEESESLDLKAAEQTYQELREGPFKDFRIGLVHGRLDDDAKIEVMRRFRDRELDLLVSTVVIEVGVDVPNATLMIIEHADRFGLSQLHQLRGRISRGQEAGQCFLFARGVTDEARQRLRALTRTTDGFVLAEEDARLRGLGEFFGTRQHGLGDLRVANLFTDQPILQQARHDAFQLVKDDPGLKRPEHELLRLAVLERYGQALDLATVG
jgi:ATP-dependent DNA helicase RecG